MYKVIIIDDEKNIREGLKIIFDWKKHKCTVIATLEDGKEGLEAAIELEPDIIITDIRMPIMDGLEMIRQLNKQNCRAKFIILSGYSDFEYAKKAISLGVKSYLLKPIEEDDLDKCLWTIIDEINREKNQVEELELSKLKSQEKIETFRDLALKDIMDGGTQKEEEIKTILDILGYEIKSNDYTCGIIEIPNQTLFGLKEEIAALEKQLMIANSFVHLFIYSKHQIGCILCNNPRRADYYYELHHNMTSFFNTQVTFAIGNPYKHLRQLSKSFNEARYALSYKLIKGRNSIITYRKITEQTKSSKVYSQEIFEKLDDFINALDLGSAKKLIIDYFYKLQLSNEVSLLDLQLNCLYFIIPTIRSLPSIQDKLTAFLGKDVLSLDEILRFNTFDELVNWLINIIASIIDIKKQNASSQNANIIDDIKVYIHKHYSENITLSSISENFFLNPHYLSQLFKARTGQNYLKYLTDIRIEEGKKLLCHTNLKIYEIASRVGYDNTKYFSKIFEKNVGCKPSTFRINNHGNA